MSQHLYFSSITLQASDYALYSYVHGGNAEVCLSRGRVVLVDGRSKGCWVLGWFLSVDPLTSSYPMLTPYQFASNTPIMAIDLDGLESIITVDKVGYNSDGALITLGGGATVAQNPQDGPSSQNGIEYQDLGLGAGYLYIQENVTTGEIHGYFVKAAEVTPDKTFFEATEKIVISGGEKVGSIVRIGTDYVSGKKEIGVSLKVTVKNGALRSNYEIGRRSTNENTSGWFNQIGTGAATTLDKLNTPEVLAPSEEGVGLSVNVGLYARDKARKEGPFAGSYNKDTGSGTLPTHIPGVTIVVSHDNVGTDRVGIEWSIGAGAAGYGIKLESSAGGEAGYVSPERSVESQLGIE